MGSWRLNSFGHRPYEFVLINPEICDIYIWNPDKWNKAVETQTGQLYFSFRSRFLQTSGIDGVRQLVQSIKKVFLGSPYGGRSGEFCRIARVDCAVDIQLDRDFSWQDLPNFVSRGRYRDDSAGDSVQKAKQIIDEKLHPPNRVTRGVQPTIVTAKELEILEAALGAIEAGDDGYLYRVCHQRRLETLYFGRFSSPLYARIYDKLGSLDKQGKEYMREIWGAAGWDGESPVWRVEFSLSGDFLKEALDLLTPDENGELPHDLRDFETFMISLPQVWQYLTTKWLRFCEPSPGDKNLWRSPLSPIWAVVQGAWLSPEPIIRVRPPRKFDDPQLTAQLKGLALTIAAKRSRRDSIGQEAYSIVVSDLWGYFESSSFEVELKQRRKLLGIDDLSDTNFSAFLRKDRIIQGCGS